VYDSSISLPAPGDIVTEINGVPAKRALDAEETFISGATPQWRRFRALVSLRGGPEHSTLALMTEDRLGKKQAFMIPRSLPSPRYDALGAGRLRPTGRIADGIYYVNLSVSSMAEIDSLMPALASARGVICDLRGYPNGNHELISHLLTAGDTSSHWMGVPKTIYPDRKMPAGYDYQGWGLQPKSPHIAGKVVFLTGGRAVSYAESYMSFIEHYRLAEIVGEPTAGTNGNINPFVLPGGYRVVWTGMRVTRHDGSPHHGIGIRPTVPVHPTITGIREGRDEQFEAALHLIPPQETSP
jgi:hypothetical protein